MDKKEIKVDCHLTAHGSEEIEDKANDDLSIPDPELAVGEEIIQKGIKDGKSENS